MNKGHTESVIFTQLKNHRVCVTYIWSNVCKSTNLQVKIELRTNTQWYTVRLAVYHDEFFLFWLLNLIYHAHDPTWTNFSHVLAPVASHTAVRHASIHCIWKSENLRIELRCERGKPASKATRRISWSIYFSRSNLHWYSVNLILTESKGRLKKIVN